MVVNQNKFTAVINSDLRNIGYVNAIDGLRAIAIISVIIYHINSNLLPSGLSGVDIFFVISGFVVSASVFSHKFTGKRDFFSFFFSRRLLRIAPALIICLLTTMAATVAFIPQAYVSTANLNAGLSAFFGLSNIVLYHSSGSYFAPRAELNPFTHTWSLAVEEQFYLLFPLLAASSIFLCSRRWSRAASLTAWIALTAISLGFARHYSLSNPTAGFYLSAGRLWELGIGVLTFLLLPYLSRIVLLLPAIWGTAIAALALVGLATSLVMAKVWVDSYPFPAVIPVIACSAILIVAIVAHQRGVVATALAWGPVAYIGKISYSLYLWHWPVFVLMRWTVGFSSTIQITFGLIATFMLAVSSYHLIEKPIRYGARRISGRAGIIVAALGCIIVSSSAVDLIHTHFPNLTDSVTGDRYIWYPEGTTHGLLQKCGLSASSGESDGGIKLNLTPVNCTPPIYGPTLFVAGDSHAGAMIRIFENAAIEQGITTHLYSLPGCPVLDLMAPESVMGAECQRYVTDTIREIANLAKPGDILFLPSLRMGRLLAMDGGALPLVPSANNQENAQNIKKAQTEATALLGQFSSSGIKVILSAPLPIFRIAPFRCSDWFNRENPVCKSGYEMPRSEIETMRSAVIGSMQELNDKFPFVSIWDPVSAFCRSDYCSALRDGKPLFFDGDHLSGWGNDILYPSFIQFIEDLRRETPSHGKTAVNN